MAGKRSIFEDVGQKGAVEAPPAGGMIDAGPKGARGAIRLWLILLFLMVAAMILIGGLTRLTDSGLSITEWNLVTGALPPLGEAAWLAEFEKYKNYPEFQLQNRLMTLEEFKTIYWWGWGHRALGRRVGLVPADRAAGAPAVAAATPAAGLDRLGLPGLRRSLRLAALGLFGFGMLQTLTLRLSAQHLVDAQAAHDTSIADQEARLTGGDTRQQPCALVGVWAASRRDSVYQVTLQDDGRFHAEPLARGAFSSGTIHGDWSVDTVDAGPRITWRYDGGAPVGPPDVNPVRDLAATGFTLVEVNGETTRYNLIRRTPGARCPAGH
mgnify:CR=1 FL=1